MNLVLVWQIVFQAVINELLFKYINIRIKILVIINTPFSRKKNSILTDHKSLMWFGFDLYALHLIIYEQEKKYKILFNTNAYINMSSMFQQIQICLLILALYEPDTHSLD